MSELVVSADPAQLARERGIDFVDGRVRVIVELVPGAVPPASVPLIVEARYEHLVQALVSPSELCNLASDPSVTLVRLAYPATPDRPQSGV